MSSSSTSRWAVTPLSPPELRKFFAILGVIGMVIFGLVLPWIFGFSIPIWPFIAFGGIMILGLIFPKLCTPIYYLWSYIGIVLNMIMTPLILSITFFLIVLPTGLIKRIFGTSAFPQPDEGLDSYRKTTDARESNHLEKPY